jgi:hypothetical protein
MRLKQYEKGEGGERPEMRTKVWSGNLNERELEYLTSGVRFEFNWLTIRLEAVMKLAVP